ncbi:VOC family protein [Qipengyuania sediminis]|uniref:VOC family protein n=1 Tax=Qipengyuania sediminis TaxID=1532023 RepID=UPI00105961AD|nr:VOC family protein [Qipengyuania sediminis]
MPVLGIGGFFFRAKDPAALKAWYKDHLGVGGGCGTDATGASNEWLWFTAGGPMVFEPFKQDSDYFPADRSAMINLRVSNLDTLLASLRGAGAEISREEAMEGVGRFARIHDPEGNPIELWEEAPASGT